MWDMGEVLGSLGATRVGVTGRNRTSPMLARQGVVEGKVPLAQMTPGQG